MLRLFVLTLLLANGLFFAWSSGLLQAYGWAPVPQTEPQRMAQQLHPERIRLLGPEELRRLEAQAAQASQPPPEPTNACRPACSTSARRTRCARP